MSNCRIGDYSLSQVVLAETNCGRVLKTCHVPSNTTFAVKMVSLTDKHKRKAFENEAEIIHNLSGSPNIIPTHRLFAHGQYGFITMKYFDTTLHTLITKKHGLPFKKARILFKEICTGVQTMHEHNIAHLRLTTTNIVIINQNAYLSDFEHSFQLECGSIRNGLFQLGTIENNTFGAPEAKVPGSFYNPVFADVWSLGYLFFTMLTSIFPGDDVDICQLLTEKIAGVKDDCLDLLRRILVVDPKRRISITDILAHPALIDLPRSRRNSIPLIRRTQSLRSNPREPAH